MDFGEEKKDDAGLEKEKNKRISPPRARGPKIFQP
jgi:hypothetical protein